MDYILMPNENFGSPAEKLWENYIIPNYPIKEKNAITSVLYLSKYKYIVTASVDYKIRV